VVYATDARVEPRVRVGLTLPASAQPEIRYPAARLAGSAHAEQAQAFLDWCAGPEGQALFAAKGFRPLAGR
jgi:molybdate transport system substrate-binding protein